LKTILFAASHKVSMQIAIG